MRIQAGIDEQSGAPRSTRGQALALLGAVLLVAAACSGEAAGAPPDTVAEAAAAAAGSAACGDQPAPTAGDRETREIVVDGTARSYILFVPSSRGDAQPAPLVLNHHGFTQTAGQQRTLSGFDETAEREGIVVAYPDAGDRAWDFTDSGDVEYVDALIDDVAASTCVDLDRVYAIGMSQGGDFSTLLACRLPDRIVAIASIAVLHHHGPPVCQSPAPIPILTVVGTADTIYSIDEGLTLDVDDGDAPGPLDQETKAWIDTNGCEPEPVESTPAAGVVRREYVCAEGNNLVVYVHGEGHIWPKQPVQNLDTNTLIWEFLSGYPAA